MFGIYLPTLSNVVAADLNEFGAVSTDDGEVLSIEVRECQNGSQIPYDVWYSQTVDVASTRSSSYNDEGDYLGDILEL